MDCSLAATSVTTRNRAAISYSGIVKPMGSSFQPAGEMLGEKLALDRTERRNAVLEIIRGARRELPLSVFRCDDFKILDEVAAAVERTCDVSREIHRGRLRPVR